MDLERIREFCVFAESLRFVDAAQKLHLSQPALSKHMKDLEAQTGLTLIRRGQNGTANQLTPAGRRFLELCTPWLEDYDSIVADCLELQNRKPPIRIQNMLHRMNINTQLRQLMDERHGLSTGNFSYVTIECPIAEALDAGLLDFGVFFEAAPELKHFSPARPQDYACIPLSPEPLCLLAGATNPLAAKGKIGLADLEAIRILTIDGSDLTHWTAAVREVFGQAGCALTFKVVLDSPGAGGAFPLGSQALSLSTQMGAQYYESLDVEDVVRLDIVGFKPVVHPFLICRRDSPNPIVRALGVKGKAVGD